MTADGSRGPEIAGTARRVNPARRHRGRWAAIIAAAAVVVIAGSAVAVTTLLRGDHSAATRTPTSPPPTAAVTTLLRGDHSAATRTPTSPSPTAADCAHPTRPYVPFSVAVAGSAEPTASVPPDRLADGVSVPYNVIYGSDGPLGTGLLCLSGGSYPGGAIALAPRPGAIAYLGLAYGDVPWGAVRPGVASLTFTGAGATNTYSAGNRMPELGLHDIGGGWRAFNSYWSLGSIGAVTLTVRAYDGAGHLLDTAPLSITTAAQSSAGPSASR